MLGVILGVVVALLGVWLMLRGRRSIEPATLPATTGRGADARAGLLTGLLGSISPRLLGLASLALGLFLIARTSYVFIEGNKVGHLKRIYATDQLAPGHVIALGNQQGPQARILGPGFHFIPLVRVLYDVEELDLVDIPNGQYGEITTADGQPMPEGMYIAPLIDDDKLAGMLDAETFLTQGGYRGPQETVLKPGQYRINRYLFGVRTHPIDTAATLIPAGSVGVVKSNVTRPGSHCARRISRMQAVR